ncbi:hypothetical protein [Haloparvum sp. AD34]
MEQLAERVSGALQDEFTEVCLVGVSYYEQEGVGHVYRSDWATEKYEPEQVDAIVEDLRLEAIAFAAHEQRQEERLHATARVYDEMIDISIPLTEVTGVVVALDREGTYRTRDVVDLVERVAERANVSE